MTAVMTRPALLRPALLLAAALAALAASFRPGVMGERVTHTLTFVVDITGSMNARDQTLDGRPASRLDMIRDTLPKVVAQLPCGSRAGLAIFTERRSFTFFTPVEVCENFAPIADAIQGLDWRMAWEGDSRIAEGLQHALRAAERDGSDIVFLTDGQEAPPLPWNRRMPTAADAGTTRGLLVGVGGSVPVPIPKFDERGRESGFYGVGDVPHESRIGAPPLDAESRPGWHPRNNPYGEAGAGSEHLTQLREPYLTDLAAGLGLRYARLETPAGLAGEIRAATRATALPAMTDLSAIPGAAGLVLLLLSYLAVPAPRRGSRRGLGHGLGRFALPFTERGVSLLRPISRPLLVAALLAASSVLVPQDAAAHGPTPQKVAESIDIPAPCELVWSRIMDFGSIGGWHRDVKGIEANGASAPGSTRRLTLQNGESITEKLDEVDGTSQSIAYRLSAENLKALPVSFYTARMGVTRSENGRSCHVDWEGRFYRGDTTNEPPPELSDEAAVAAMTAFFQTGLQGLAGAMK